MDKAQIVISTDRNLLDLETIYSFLKTAYWGKDKTNEQIKLSIDHSIPFGMYEGKKLIGFARVLSDRTVMAYLMDVFVLKEYRGNGLGKHLMEHILEYPDFAEVKTWLLATQDAHRLYEQFGFKPIDYPEVFMEKKRG